MTNPVNDFTWLEKNLKSTDTKADKLKKIKKFTGAYPKLKNK